MILINKSLSLDDKLVEAHYLKSIYYREVGEPEQALEEYEKCLRYNPSYWQAYLDRATYIYGVNCKDADYVKGMADIQKAISHNQGKERPNLMRFLAENIGVGAGFPHVAEIIYKNALDIDNDSMQYFSSLSGLFTFIEPEKAERYARKWLLLNPKSFRAKSNLGDLLAYKGDFSNALRYHIEFSNWIKNTNQLGAAHMHRVAYTYWKNGNKEEADFWFRRQKNFDLVSIRNNRYPATIAPTSYYDLACVYAFEGKKDSAYLNLKKLDEMMVFPFWWISLIKMDPLLESLRTDKEFQDLVNRLESKYQAEHERVRKWLEENNML